MKKNRLKSFCLALFCFTAGVPLAHAVTTFSQGDLIFGVRDTSGAVPFTYLFDLGTPPASGLVPGNGTVASGLGADLSAIYGSNWYTNTSLAWSISGYEAPNVLDVSKAESTYGTQATTYSGAGFSANGRNNITPLFDNVVAQGGNGSDTNAAIQAAGFTAGGYSTAGGAAFNNSDPNGYASYMPGYNGSFGTSMEGLGFSNVALDIFQINGTTAGGNPGNPYTGTFTVDSSGDVIYSSSPPIVGVPEPGRAALLGLGIMGLLVRRRRSDVRAA